MWIEFIPKCWPKSSFFVLSIGFEKFIDFFPSQLYDVIIWYIIFSGEGEEDIIKEKKKEKESI